MAKFEFKGINEYVAQLQKLYEDTDQIIGAAIYQGAGVVVRQVEAAVSGIQTDEHYGTTENPCMGPKAYQKRGLQESLGIAKLRKDGTFWNVKIGFDGYNGMKTKRWPQGQPNAMIARSVESGTSFMTKQPFMRKAETASRKKCEEAMGMEIDKQVSKRVKER